MEQSRGDETSSRGRSAGIGQSRVGGGRASDQSQLLYCVAQTPPQANSGFIASQQNP